MKNELKISTLSIVCVLCTAVAMPAFGVSSVRSLGGAGTYTSASSAAAAKSDKTSSATNSVRGGSMRVNNSASASRNATRSSSTRTATTPRLSIGKYLAGSSAISGGSSNRVEIDKIQGEMADANDQLQSRIVNLEKALGLFSEEGLSGKLIVDVEQLQDDLNDMTGVGAGYVVTADYTDDVLTIKQGDKTVLSENFATSDGLAAIQEKLDELTTALADKASQSEVDALESALARLEATVENLDSVSATDYATQVQTLKDADTALQSAIDELEKIDHSLYAEKTYVDDLIDGLDAVDTELKAADTEINKKIAALETGSSESGADLTDVKAQLKTATDSLSALTTRVAGAEAAIKANADAIVAIESNKADKTALNDLGAALRSEIAAAHERGDYATAGELTALMNRVAALETTGGATTTDVAALQTSINNIVATYATKDALAASEEALLAKIIAIDLTPYAKLADLNAYAKTADLGDLAYEDSIDSKFITSIDGNKIIANTITDAQIADGSITAVKLNPNEIESGAMAMLQVNPDTGAAEWVSVVLVDDPSQAGY